MSKLPMIARILLGLIFVVFGLNGLLDFMQMPPFPEAAGAYLGAMMETGYAWPLLKLTEIAAGLLLLSGRFVPLALLLLAPIVVNITLFHIFLAPSGLPLGIVVLVLMLYLAHAYWPHFRGIFSAAEPA